jgi:hypothetical protein
MLRRANAAGMQAAGTLASVARSAPESLLLLALIGVTAVWATWAGTLPGWSFHLLGASIQGILWTCLYAGLAMSYHGIALRERKSARSVLLRLGLCLPLALLSTYICKLLLVPLLAPAAWSEFFYLRFLLPPVFVGLWCAALLPQETRALYRAATTNSSIVPLPDLVLLLASAAVLVSCADLVFQWTGSSAVDVRLKSDIVLMNAWTTNVLILFSAYALVFAATSKVAVGHLLVSPLYVMLGLATLAKIEYMHSAVQPLDLIRVAEFVPLFRSFFGAGVLVAAIAALGIWIIALVLARRREPSRVSIRRRWSIGLTSFLILLALSVAFAVAPSVPAVNGLLVRLGAPQGEHREKARRNGFLLSFLSEIPSVFVFPPGHYSPAAVAGIVSKYQKPGDPVPKHGPRVNLIVYLVESFMDPDDLGWHYTSEPTPNLRGLRKDHITGYGIVPEQFGGSANTEFELLTGMTRSFLPEGSLPYRQYLRRPIPSLPRALSNLGYATIAIQADPKYYYDRERVYDLLGFQTKVWLRGVAGIKRAARGPWPSDDAVVETIIRTSHGPHPFFVFAFPSSTHSPYNFGAYRDADLDVLDSLSSQAHDEVKEYINALRDADRSIGTLIEYFRRQPDSTIIAILGDHLPPLPKQPLRALFTSLSGMSKPERARMLHRVPLMVWTNFGLPRDERELSLNAIPSFLLEKMRIPPTGFLSVSDAVRRKLPVVGSYVQGANGHIWDPASLPDEERALLEDYRVLQYDLLLGKQYALRDSVPGWAPIPAR